MCFIVTAYHISEPISVHDGIRLFVSALGECYIYIFLQLSARGGEATPTLEVLGPMLSDEEFNPFSPESGSLADAARHGKYKYGALQS